MPSQITRQITRHVLTIPAQGGKPARKVHYRRCGQGPALLMVHQSPRSSSEYTELMRDWAAHFTCIAPDTPGFGQSDPLPGEPEINDFADAILEFADALGIAPCAAYGFHSGGIILVTAIKRRPQAFRCLAVGGYAIWTPEEMRIFGESYLPEFVPQPYGEHLAWIWSRILEQSWVFPWFDTREEARMSIAHADVEHVARTVSEMLDAGEHYRAGYGAVLRAPRDIPAPDAVVPPCLISAYDGDPLQAHIDRLGAMPASWSAQKVATPKEHQDLSLAFLKEHADTAPCGALPEDGHEGWLELEGGLIHWKGAKGGRLRLHRPAEELADPSKGEIAIDVPGHGQSDDFDDMKRAVEASAEALGVSDIDWPAPPAGDADRLYPDMAPDRFGLYLQRAWQVARAEAFFAPWYEANAAHAVPLTPEAIATPAVHARALARIRAGAAARRWHDTLAQIQGETA
ncbi:alpha/beta fold hydrolase [Erythrobacter sp.]|uniref:alpha/beta hydrolase n=1 Tax=Erythrobacter sp. TaxID=1042 RepID=UPI0025C6EB8C|nr:alpha/beta fold hydrolase [Erythrobacter sp.]